jgi:hypothetical protein
MVARVLALAPDLHGRFCDRPEPESRARRPAPRVLRRRRSAGSARTLDLESLGVERSGRGAQAAAQ